MDSLKKVEKNIADNLENSEKNIADNLENAEKNIVKNLEGVSININNNLLGTGKKILENINDKSSNKLIDISNLINDYEDKIGTHEQLRSKVVFNNSQNPKKTEYCILFIHGYSDVPKIADPILDNIADHYKANILKLRTYGENTLYDNSIEPYNSDKLLEKVETFIKYALELGDKLIIVTLSAGALMILKYINKYINNISHLIQLSPFYKLLPAPAYVVDLVINNKKAIDILNSDKWYLLLDDLDSEEKAMFLQVAPQWPYYTYKEKYENETNEYNEIQYDDSKHALFKMIWENALKLTFKFSDFNFDVFEKLNYIQIGEIRDTAVDEEYNKQVYLNLKSEKKARLELSDHFNLQSTVTINDKEYSLDDLEGYNRYSLHVGYGYGNGPVATNLVTKFIIDNL